MMFKNDVAKQAINSRSGKAIPPKVFLPPCFCYQSHYKSDWIAMSVCDPNLLCTCCFPPLKGSRTVPDVRTQEGAGSHAGN